MNHDYVKAILYVYPKLDALSEAVRQSALNKALLSYRSRKGALADALSVAEEYELADRIDALKRQTDAILSLLGKEERFFLEYRYFRRKSVLKQYPEVLVLCSERSYFRRQAELLNKIAAKFALQGLSEGDFLGDYRGCECLMRVYRAIAAGREYGVFPKRDKRGVFFEKRYGSSDEERRFLNNSTTTTARDRAERTITIISAADSPAAL